MANSQLQGRKIAILATDGFEQSELFEPKKTLEDAGAEIKIVSLKSGKIKAWNKTDWGESIPVDMTVEDAHAADFDAVVLPGGVMNPDKLRTDERAVDFVRGFAQEGKVIAAICHGPWTLIEAGIVAGRRMTSYGSIRTDLVNAGAEWSDEEVVTDNGLITSRKPADIPAFSKKIIEEISEGRHRPVMAQKKGEISAGRSLHS